MQKENICQFSPTGNVFAYSSTGILKFWNADSGVLEHQYHPAEYLATTTTCLKFCPSKKHQSKKRRSKSIGDKSENCFENGQVVAIGTISGKILIYSIAQQELVCTLEHSSVSSIVDLLWSLTNEGQLFSLACDKTVVKWNILERKKILTTDVAGDCSMCYIGPNLYVTAGMCIQIAKIKKEGTDLQEVYSSILPISILVPLFIQGEKIAKYVISASREDRMVYIWSTEGSLKKSASFKVGDIVRDVSCIVIESTTLALAVTTKKGIISFFKHHLNGYLNNKKPIACSSQLIIESSQNKSKEKKVLQIISSRFLSDSTLAFAYCPDFPACEKIALDQLEKNVTLVRMEPRLRKIKSSSLIKTVTPFIPDNVAHIMPNSGQLVEEGDTLTKFPKAQKRKKGDPSRSLPLEECLSALSIERPSFSNVGGAPLSSNIQLLVQGLHSKDERLLQSILLKGDDDEVVDSTVKRLPVVCIDPFMKYLQEAIAKGANKNLCYVKWMKSIFYHHMSHLSSMSSKKSLMAPFESVCTARLRWLPQVTKLHSRLSLILTHISNRHENASSAVQPQSVALLTYCEDSEDDSVKEKGNHLTSESEDIWDDLGLSDKDDEEEKPVNGDVEMIIDEAVEEEEQEVSGEEQEDSLEEEEEEEQEEEEDEEQEDLLEEEEVNGMEVEESDSDGESDLSPVIEETVDVTASGRKNKKLPLTSKRKLSHVEESDSDDEYE